MGCCSCHGSSSHVILFLPPPTPPPSPPFVNSTMTTNTYIKNNNKLSIHLQLDGCGWGNMKKFTMGRMRRLRRDDPEQKREQGIDHYH